MNNVTIRNTKVVVSNAMHTTMSAEVVGNRCIHITASGETRATCFSNLMTTFRSTRATLVDEARREAAWDKQRAMAKVNAREARINADRVREEMRLERQARVDAEKANAPVFQAAVTVTPRNLAVSDVVAPRVNNRYRVVNGVVEFG